MTKTTKNLEKVAHKIRPGRWMTCARGAFICLSLFSLMNFAACDSGASHRGKRGNGASEDPGKKSGRGGKADRGGGEDGRGDRDQSGETGEETPLPKLSLAPESLVWKRYRAFEDGLSQGLQIDKTQLCLELGQHACIEKVHLTVLGGNEPYTMGQYESASTPTVLTSVAVDRIVLAACSSRLKTDLGLGAGAVIFKNIPLRGAAVTGEHVKSQTSLLYQKLLSRDASTDELTVAAKVLEVTTVPDKVALALCFMVGTQIENIFL